MENVTTTFRENCYDQSKRQRLLLRSNGLTLSNEDIAVGSGVRFNLASITSTQQVQFGCTPCNSINVAILNEDGRITSNSIVGNEFYCDIGVESDTGEYNAPPKAISAISTNYDYISVHSEAPYIRGNCTFGNIHPQLVNGYKCKIMYAYNVLYFVISNEGTLYYVKYVKTGTHTYGEYTTPSDTECAILDKLMKASYDAVAYYDGGMVEYTYDREYGAGSGTWATARGSIISLVDAIKSRIPSWVVGLNQTPGDSYIPSSNYETWNDMLNRTWGGAKEKTWGDYSGYSIFTTVVYESVPYGVWHFDRPRRINSAVLTLNGKDRMTIFDEDSSNYVSSVANTLMTVRDMIVSIANYKNVPVGDLSGLNELVDEIVVDQKTYYQNKSLKDLLSYLFEVGGANAIIDRRGCLSASNSANVPIALPYVYSFDVADSVAHTIGSMLVYKQGEYTQYETDDTVTDGVAYDWTDNPYFNNMLLSGSWFSNGENKKYGGFHNAVTVSDADYSLWCDDVYSWTDDEGTFVEPIFTISIEWNGNGRVTYTNYGEEERQYASYDSRMQGVSSVNDKNLQGFNKAQYANKLYFDENGLTVQSNGLTIKSADDERVFYADDEGNLVLKGNVQAENGYIGEWKIEQGGLVYEYVGNLGDTNKMALMPASYNNKIIIEDSAYKIEYSDTGLWFEYSDNGSKTFGGLIDFGFDESSSWIEIRCGQTGGTAPTSVDIEARVINLIAPDGLYYTAPTTTSSANVVFVGTQIYKTSSLREVKDNIKTIENASETVDNLRGVSFTSKCKGDDPNKVFYGLIAEEVEKACPELATYEDGKLQSVQYDRVCALLIEDNKACHRRIEALEKRLEELERRLDK